MDLTNREKALAYFRNREAQTPMPGARAMCQEAIKALEQPEVIRCKDCKYHSHDAEYGRDWCNRTSGVFRVKPDDFCSRAERRSDE